MKLTKFTSFFQNFVDRMVCGKPRSSEWPKTELEYLTKHPTCEVCGELCFKNGKKIRKCVAHHILPFYLYPELELQADNLATVCSESERNCHLIFGHLFNFRAYNPNFREDAKVFREKVKNRICHRI